MSQRQGFLAKLASKGGSTKPLSEIPSNSGVVATTRQQPVVLASPL